MTQAVLHTADEIRNASSLVKSADMIRANMLADNRWLIRGLLAIYARQTFDEQASETTKHHNSKGFSALDASILSSYAAQVEQWEATPPNQRRYNSPLSTKQMSLLRRRMMRYSGQLARVVRERVQVATDSEPSEELESVA